LIDELIQTQHVDPKRIYVTGHSNGGMLAYRLGAELSAKIAAISVSAGTIGGKADLRSPEVRIQKPAEPLSVLVFHGKLDQNVLYDGGITVKGVVKGRYDLSVAQSVGFWVAADHCTGQPQIKGTGDIAVSDYTACEQNTEVTLYTIANQGHAWPGGSSGLIDTPTKAISATELSWEFFKAHPKT
jgi:polyhydroxybutyrate depolymerase